MLALRPLSVVVRLRDDSSVSEVEQMMVSPPREAFEVIIIGGGIAGNALAAVLAQAGRAILVLERSTVYRDRVRGEVFQPWGVAEARRLDLHETLKRAGGTHHSRFVPYDETVEPAEAEAAALALDKILPGVPGTLGVGHPRACEELRIAAAAAGAQVLQGIENTETELGHGPTVRYSLNGAEHAARCRLVIGADGRESAVRRRAGITLHATEPRLSMAGCSSKTWAAGRNTISPSARRATWCSMSFRRVPGERGCISCGPATGRNASPAARVRGPSSTALPSSVFQTASAS